MQAPPALYPGARIAVIAPASPFDVVGFEAGVARLRQRYDVSYREDVLTREAYLAGSDDRRLEELKQALQDPAIHGIVAARGGYGSTRLLEHLPETLIAQHPKLLVGFSDVTALHAAWARAGLRSLHASMAVALGAAGDEAWQRWIAAAEGQPSPAVVGLRTWVAGHARGALVGGNLAVLAALVGTPYSPPLDGRILFIEDVGERPYRVDRMLTQLRHAGWFQRVAGVVVGQFTRCDPGPDTRTVEAVVEERLADLSIPVVTGVVAGHGDENLPLPLGGLVEVHAHVGANGGAVRFAEPATVSGH